MYRYALILRFGKGPLYKSPHRRGDVPPMSFMQVSRGVNLPTGVGMYRHAALTFSFGGASQNLPTGVGMYRQRPRGVFALRSACNLPTGVGMYRLFCFCLNIRNESPHRRGDVPDTHTTMNWIDEISPQAWGCTVPYRRLFLWRNNLPTGVGMYRPSAAAVTLASISPLRRGDVPGLPL